MFWPSATPKTGLPSFQDFTKSTPEQFQNPPLLPNFGWNMFSPVQDNRFDTASPRFSPWGFNGYPLSLTPNSGKSSPAQATEQPTYLDSSSSASSVSDLRTNTEMPGDAQPGFQPSSSSKKKHRRPKSQTPKSSQKVKTVKDILFDQLDDSNKASSVSSPCEAASEMGQVYPNMPNTIPQPVLPEARHYQISSVQGLPTNDQGQPLPRFCESEMPPDPGLLHVGISSPVSQVMIPTDLSKYSAEKKDSKVSTSNAKMKETNIDTLAKQQKILSPHPSYSSIVSPPIGVSYAPKTVLPSPQLPAHTSSSGDMHALPTYSESSLTSSRPASTASFASLDSNISAQTQNPDAAKRVQTEQEFKELDRDTEREILRRIFSCSSLELCDPKALGSRPRTSTNPETSSMHLNKEMISPNPKPKKKKRTKKPKEGQPPAPFMPSQCPVPPLTSVGTTSTSDQEHVPGETVHSNTIWPPEAVVSPSSAGVTSQSPQSALPRVTSQINNEVADTQAEPLELDSKPSTTFSNSSSENSGQSTNSSGSTPHLSTSTLLLHTDSVQKPSMANPPNVISYEHLKNCMTPEQLMVSAYSKDLYERIQKHLLQTRDSRIPSDVQAQESKDSTPSPNKGRPVVGGIQGKNDPSHKASQINSNLPYSSKNSTPGPDFNKQFLDFVGKSSPPYSKGNNSGSGIHYARDSPHIPKISPDNAGTNNPEKHEKIANPLPDLNSLDKLLALSKTLPTTPSESAIAKLDRVIASVDIGDGQQSSHLGRLTDFNGTCNSSLSAVGFAPRPEEQQSADVSSQPLVSNVQKTSSPKVENHDLRTAVPASLTPLVSQTESNIKCPPHLVFIPPVPEPIRTPDLGTVASVSLPMPVSWPESALKCQQNQVLIPPASEPNRTSDLKDTIGLDEKKLKDPYDFESESPPHVPYPSQQMHSAYSPFSDSRRMPLAHPVSNSQPMPGVYPGADAYMMPRAYPPSSDPQFPPGPPVSEQGYVNTSGSYAMEVNTGDGAEKFNIKQEDLPPQAQAEFDKNLDLLQRLRTNTAEMPHCNCLKEGRFWFEYGSSARLEISGIV
jgi:hypothetical protein